MAVVPNLLELVHWLNDGIKNLNQFSYFESDFIELFFNYNTGRWFYFNELGQRKPFKKLNPKWIVKEVDYRFCFVPFADLFGEVEVEVMPVYIIDSKTHVFGTETAKFIIKINATNDRPIVRDPQLEITALPYNMSGYLNPGVLVSDFITKKYGKKKDLIFADKDKDQLGK